MVSACYSSNGYVYLFYYRTIISYRHRVITPSPTYLLTPSLTPSYLLTYSLTYSLAIRYIENVYVAYMCITIAQAIQGAGQSGTGCNYLDIW